MTLTVTTARFVLRQRLPTTFVLAGRYQLAAGPSVRCGDDVTLSIEDGLWTQTIPGSRFTVIAGLCTYVRRGSDGLLAGVVFDTRRGRWLATGLGPSGMLPGVTNPVAIALTIGDDAGSATVTASLG